MNYDEVLIAGKLRRWEKYLNRFNLPDWESIPDFGLYMEQVVQLLKQYIDYMPPELKEEQVVTASAINNYVRTNVMPGPCRKKYYRIHIAYLIVICTLKQSLSIAMIQKIIPMGIAEEQIREIYEQYAETHRVSSNFFVRQIRTLAAELLNHDDVSEFSVHNTSELIATSAIISGFSRLLAEKLLLLENCSLENGGSIEIE